MLFIVRLFFARIAAALVRLKRRFFPVKLDTDIAITEVKAILTQLLLDHVSHQDLTPEMGEAACKAKGRVCPASFASSHYASMTKVIPYLASALLPAPSPDGQKN